MNPLYAIIQTTENEIELEILIYEFELEKWNDKILYKT